MLAMGVHPAITAATSACMILFTSFMATTSFVVFGLLVCHHLSPHWVRCDFCWTDWIIIYHGEGTTKLLYWGSGTVVCIFNDDLALQLGNITILVEFVEKAIERAPRLLPCFP
jgi:hypothetical protein